MSTPKTKLSIRDRAVFLAAIVKTLLAATGGMVTGLIRSSSQARSYKKYVLYTIMRAYSKYVPTRIMQATSPTTADTYNKFIQSKSLPSRTSTMEDGSTGYWIGEEDATAVLLFFHGGGYAMSAVPPHFQILHGIEQLAKSKGCSFSAVVIEYTLAPATKYPSQLTQAVNAYKHLTEKLDIHPSRIIIAGDSAGAHLSLGLLSHLTHPQPELPKTSATEPVAGTLLISPWVTFSTTAASMQTNRYKDCIDAGPLEKWSQAFIGDAVQDNYNMPLKASPAWWSNTKSKKICVIAGQDELFVDDIEAFVGKLKVHRPDVDYFVADAEPHDSPVLYSMMNLEEAAATRKLREFVLETCLSIASV
ncbi:hypothetical protein Z517_06840 [Fonsecaea pedrosoi CBS 271.37]|uniref:Alpha/beta hydrolase fold-3 domain-containing protein n=1 Tax=Fonsecaea pedrosoi CBS 271.37 TaxID=1442368 RepID=A0A0D2GNR9_9EURO|nr:uncharacterized protein Z517_06840 [Fonsecaea pedrosoi CBS 271.37]KIW80225.1 hypothetical protein Z517_06840 [Fonsecaea pedrosoi CBS 271.37]